MPVTPHNAQRPYRGVFPVAPTIFDERGELDLEGQRRCIDFMIDAGSHGLCILANFSEQFVLTDAERETVMHAVLEHVAGRVPVIVTTTHFSSAVCAARSQQAAGGRCRDGDGDAALSRRDLPGAGEGRRRILQGALGAINIPIMIQDAPVAGTPLSVELLARLARDFAQHPLFQDRGAAGAASKLRSLIEAGGKDIEGPWDGEEAITLLADLDAGATGAMTGGGYPDGIRQIIDPYFAGKREEAKAAYERWLPLINYENRQCGLIACKAMMQAGGVIKSDAVRHPLQPLHPATRAGLLELAKERDALALRWGK